MSILTVGDSLPLQLIYPSCGWLTESCSADESLRPGLLDLVEIQNIMMSPQFCLVFGTVRGVHSFATSSPSIHLRRLLGWNIQRS